MKCFSVRKEDDFVTVCVLCTLSFWKSDYYHQMLLLWSPWCQFTALLHIGFLLEWGNRSNFRKEVFSNCIIPDLSFQSLSIVNIWKDRDLALSGSVSFIKLHLLVFSPCSFVLQSFFNPYLSCEQYCTGQHLGVFDKKTGLLGLQRSEQFSRWSHLLFTHIPSPDITYTIYFSTSPVYTCTVLLFVLWFIFPCLHICCQTCNSPHEEVKNSHGEDDHNSHQHRHIPLSLTYYCHLQLTWMWHAYYAFIP